MARFSPLSILFIPLFVITACNAPDKQAEWQTMTLYGSSVVLIEVHDGDEMREHGEQLFYEAKLSDQAGKSVGQALGMAVIVDMPGDDKVDKPATEERFVTMAIVFEDGDEIMTMGAFEIPENEKYVPTNVPQSRAIIGGTGKYMGIRGQMKVTRNADDTFSLTLEYKVD